jgi:hypothetical protein
MSCAEGLCIVSLLVKKDHLKRVVKYLDFLFGDDNYKRDGHLKGLAKAHGGCMSRED